MAASITVVELTHKARDIISITYLHLEMFFCRWYDLFGDQLGVLFIFRQFEHRVNRHKRYIPPAVNPNPPI